MTRHGKPVAVLLSIEDEEELERLVLAYTPKFKSILEAGRAQIREYDEKETTETGRSQVPQLANGSGCHLRNHGCADPLPSDCAESCFPVSFDGFFGRPRNTDSLHGRELLVQRGRCSSTLDLTTMSRETSMTSHVGLTTKRLLSHGPFPSTPL